MVATQPEEASGTEESPGVDGDGFLCSEENRPTSHPYHPADQPALRRSSRMRKPLIVV
jgi:hypothetical protein